MLLSKNHSLLDQNFAVFLDKAAVMNYDDLKINVLTCDVSLLPHIAVQKGADISGMYENEAKLYLSTFSKKFIGTIGAVEDAVNVHFENAKVVEWFEDKDNLKRGMFRIDADIDADKNKIFDDRLFFLSKRLVNSAKNVRSKLDFINLKLSQQQLNIKNGGGAVINIKLKNELNFNSELNLNLTGGIAWTI
jgi:P2-related tail formation protein